VAAQRGVLTIDQRDQLNRLVRDKSVDAVLALRARLVLWWDNGHSAVQIAQWAGVTDKTARLWPVRYVESGIDGLRGYRIRGSRERMTTGFVPASLLSAGQVRQSTPVCRIGPVAKWRNI
jgi:hypothetical protein